MQPPTLRTIDLTHCVADRLKLASVAQIDIDPRHDFRQAITIECLQQDYSAAGGDNNDEVTMEYVIAATSSNDLNIWVRELNRVLEFVRDWRL